MSFASLAMYVSPFPVAQATRAFWSALGARIRGYGLDAPVALDSGAVGIGLFRSEFLFMNRGGELPSEDEQFEAYRGVVEAMRGLPVTIRTVDIGADKPLDRLTVHGD